MTSKSQKRRLETMVDEGLVEVIKKWAIKEEAIDKFGDILLETNVNDISSLALAIQKYYKEQGWIKLPRKYVIRGGYNPPPKDEKPPEKPTPPPPPKKYGCLVKLED